jgi:hypothetical protein
MANRLNQEIEDLTNKMYNNQIKKIQIKNTPVKKKLAEKDIILSFWENSVDDVAEYFRLKYFGKNSESWWIAEEVGGVFYINDYFFNLKDMVDFIKYKYSSTKMFEYYEYSLGCAEEGVSPINIKNYKKLK